MASGYSKSSAGICVQNQTNVSGSGSTFKLGVDTGYKVYNNHDDLNVSGYYKMAYAYSLLMKKYESYINSRR